MSTTDQEWVQKEIQGFCEGIMERGDWTEFHINIGKQYAVKLSTKLPEVIEAGRAAGKEQAIWRFGEADGADNPHRPGTKYKNRRLSGVEVGGQLTMSDTGSSSSGGGGGRGGGGGAHSPEERRSIEKQTILKAMIPLPPEDRKRGRLVAGRAPVRHLDDGEQAQGAADRAATCGGPGRSARP